MKHLIIFLVCALFLVSCGLFGESSRPAPPTPKHSTDTVALHQMQAPTIKVYLENSGSMDGYVKGKTDFENAVYSYLSDIQYADLGYKTETSALKNILELNYINSKILKQRPDIQEFIKALEPANFRVKGGSRGVSDMSEILKTILSNTQDDNVSVFISDCIFSPGRRYEQNNNADEYIVQQQIAIKSHIKEKMQQSSEFSIVVLRLLSQFNGKYYNKYDHPSIINDRRPFYIWLLGNRSYLQTILREVDISKIKGNGVMNTFMISNPVEKLSYSILRPQHGHGQYMLDNTTKSITDVETEKIGGNSKFEVNIAVDFSHLLLPDEYLMDINNYSISNKAYGIKVAKYLGPNKTKYTHTIKLVLLEPFIRRGTINISLMKVVPSWIEEYTDLVGLDINKEGAMDKTYGLKYLLEGVCDAYSGSTQYGNIIINIK